MIKLPLFIKRQLFYFFYLKCYNFTLRKRETMVIGENLYTQSANEIYTKLNQNYAKLDSIDKQEDAQKFDKDEYFRSSKSENFDQRDYERVVKRFEDADSQVRLHEQTHAASSNLTSTPKYDYQVGPDGKLYATGGEVRIDTSIPDDEKAAQVKLDEIEDTASAPNNLSSADAQISRQAQLNKALLQLKGDENAS